MNSLLRWSSRPSNTVVRRRSRRACFELLERRALLSASVSVSDITSSASAHNVIVTYSDPAGIDAGTIGNDDLAIGGPKSVNVELTNLTGGSTELVATYSLAGPGGTWDSDDNGGYSVSVNPGSIQNLDGSNTDISGGSANFNVAVPAPDTTGPSTSISVGDINTAGGSSHTVSVTYSDSSGINQDSIGASDVTVEHNGSSLNVTNVDVSGSGDSRTATYTFAAPGGSWDQGDNGSYTVTVNAGAVQDNNGNGNAADSDSFTVNAPTPADTSAPTASISVNDINGPKDTHTVSVEYSDNVAIDTSSIDAGDINVTFNGASLSVTNVQVTTSANGKKATAVYTVAGPGGSFDHTDNGTYVVRVVPGAVVDSSGNAAISSPTNFDVNIAGPVDNTGPTASIASIGAITTAGGASFNVVVTYTDETAMDPSTIGPSDLNVSKDGPGGDLSVTGVSTNVSGDGKSVVATYTVGAPGGSFDAADNGNYTVSVVTSQVRDAADNNVQSASSGFAVSIAALPPVDVLPPTAVISAGNITTAGAATHAITVVYTDETAMDVSSIGPADISVSGPGGALTVTSATTSVSAGGKVVTATYTVAAPGGGFDAADNGAYSVSLNAGAVRDAAGNAAVGTGINFNVAITTAPPVDVLGPSVSSISAPNINAPGGSTQTVTVVYVDDGKIRTNTISDDDIVVTRGGTTLAVSDVSFTSANDGKQVTAVYTLAAPGGTWDTADNGDYTITVQQGAVSDAKGNLSSAAGGGFNVNATIVDTADPIVSGISAGNVTTEGVSSHVVTVTYTDDAGLNATSFGTDDVTVSGPGGTLAINVISTATSEDGKSATVTYTFAAPGDQFLFEHNGTYTITVNAGAVTDASGKPVAPASGSFTVAVPEQTPIDPGFGEGNAVNTSFVAEAVTAAPDGKLIVVGRSGTSAVIERRNANGTLDTTFGTNGQVVRTQENAYYAVVIQGDNIVVAGAVGGDFVLVRFTSTGQVDQSFGGSERRAVITFGDAVTERVDEAYALALAPDGKLVAGGRTDGDFALARFTSDGLIDNTFGQLGKQMYDINGGDAIGALVVQADGKIVAAGTSGTQVVVVRLGTNGEADLGFSGDGLLTVSGLVARNDPTAPDRSAALALQADGKILVGNHTAGNDFGVVRIDPNGNVDSSFGNDGLATADFGGSDDADAILVQPTGEILVVGTSLSGEIGMTTLAAFDSGGHLITDFGEGGKLMLESGVVNSARELHLGDLVLRAFGTRQSDGRVVVGTSNTAPQQPSQPTTIQSALRRLNVPGTRSTPSGTAIGTFGVVNGRTQKLTHTDDDGTLITFTIKGGTGTAFRGSDGRINIVVNDASSGATISIKTRGGDGRVALGDVMVNGLVKSLSAKTGDLTGTMSVSGAVGKITLGNVTNASICSSGNIGSITLTSLINSKLLAGSSLGANAEFGGTGANADAYGAASIGKLRVSGVIQNSTVGAGLDPVDATFLDEDDRVIGGATASFIRSITAKDADSASRFLSASFGKVKLGTKVTPGEDPRFRVLA